MPDIKLGSLRVAILPVTRAKQNCSIVWDDSTREAVVIDPGPEVDRILEQVDKAELSLKAVWLTHGHLDHAGGAADIRDRRAVPVIGPHIDDQWLLDSQTDQGEAFGIEGGRNLVPDRYLIGGDCLSLGSTEFLVEHCPGHTPGHIVFISPEVRLAFVGDVLFKGSVGNWSFPRGDRDALINSITHKLWPYGRDISFVSGHGPISTFGTERESNSVVADSLLG